MVLLSRRIINYNKTTITLDKKLLSLIKKLKIKLTLQKPNLTKMSYKVVLFLKHKH